MKVCSFGVGGGVGGSVGVRKMTRSQQTSSPLKSQRRTCRRCSLSTGFRVHSLQESVDLDTIVESFEHKPPTSRPIVSCYGCGVELQTEDANAIGFVEEEKLKLKLKHKQHNQLLCNRCVELAHGKMIPGVKDTTSEKEAPFSNLVTPEELREKLKSVREKRVLVVLLVDLLDLPGSFLNALRPLIGGNPIFLVGTKLDLLPKSTKIKPVEEWLLEMARERKLNVIDIHLISNRTTQGIGRATSSILHTRNGRDVYVMGLANVGKSAFVKTFLRELQTIGSSNFTPHAMSKKRFLPVESSMPGTTLGIIKLQALSRKGAVYDTPGIHITHRITHLLNLEELASLHPTRKLASYVPPTPYEISKQELQRQNLESGRFQEGDILSVFEEEPEEASGSYLWGGIARIDVLQAPVSLGLVFVGPRTLKAHAFPLLPHPSTSKSGVNDIYHQITQGHSLDQMVTTRYLDLETLMEGALEKKSKGVDLKSVFFGRDSVMDRGGLFIAREFEIECHGFEERMLDFCISGVPGWVTVVVPKMSRKRNEGVFKGRVWAPKGIEVFLRPPIPVNNPLEPQY